MSTNATIDHYAQTHNTHSHTQHSSTRRSSRAPSLFSQASTTIADNFTSEEAYMNALKSWAEGKKYYEADIQLKGFYGTKTKQEIMDSLPPPPSFRRKRKSVSTDKARASVAGLERVMEDRESGQEPEQRQATTAPVPGPAETKTGGGLKRLFARRKTIA